MSYFKSTLPSSSVPENWFTFLWGRDSPCKKGHDLWLKSPNGHMFCATCHPRPWVGFDDPVPTTMMTTGSIK